MPYFWVRDPTAALEDVQAVFADLPELRSAVLMDVVGDRGLFRAEWKPEYMGIMGAIGAIDVVVVSVTGSEAGWTFELRATDAGQFSEFQRLCAEEGIGVTLGRLRQLSETATGSAYDLTPDQREALVLAYDEGYYDEPRATNQEDLASHLGISRQPLSSRLRRGYRNLLESTIVPARRDD